MQVVRKHPNFLFTECDLRNASALADLPVFDTVVHLAAKAGVRPSIENPQDYIDTNITGTHHLLKLCVDRGVRKIAFASSSSIYGNSKDIPFVELGRAYKPISPYAFTKRSAEYMNYTYHHLYNLDILNLRFFTVYGPRQRPDLAIHKFVKLIDAGQPIPVFGDGTTARDYTFIDDTISGVYGALEYLWENDSVFEIVNLGNNTPVQLKTLIDAIATTLNKPVKIDRLPMQQGDVDITYADISKARRMFGYDPQTDLQKGLSQFVEWYKEFH